jgi:hypothetical protein
MNPSAGKLDRRNDMRATKPNVTRAAERAGFKVVGVTFADRTEFPGATHVTKRMRDRVRVFFVADHADPAVTRPRATPDANGFHWEFTDDFVDATWRWAFNVRDAMRDAGFGAGVFTFDHQPVAGGEWFVEVVDAP